jgi:hypothetical protein
MCNPSPVLLLQKARVEAQQQLEWTQWQVQQLSEELAVAQVRGVLAGSRIGWLTGCIAALDGGCGGSSTCGVRALRATRH